MLTFTAIADVLYSNNAITLTVLKLLLLACLGYCVYGTTIMLVSLGQYPYVYYSIMPAVRITEAKLERK